MVTSNVLLKNTQQNQGKHGTPGRIRTYDINRNSLILLNAKCLTAKLHPKRGWVIQKYKTKVKENFKI